MESSSVAEVGFGRGGGGVVDEERLWDELSHQQSKEIQQHYETTQQQQQQRHRRLTTTTTTTTTTARSSRGRVHNTETLSSAMMNWVKDIWSSTKEMIVGQQTSIPFPSWQNHHHHAARYVATPQADNLDEFGLPEVGRGGGGGGHGEALLLGGGGGDGDGDAEVEDSSEATTTYEAFHQQRRRGSNNNRGAGGGRYYYDLSPSRRRRRSRGGWLSWFSGYATATNTTMSVNDANDDDDNTGVTDNNDDHDGDIDDDDAFVLLRPFSPWVRARLRFRNGWGAVSNLDLFFINLYHYYYHRGFTKLCAKGMVEWVGYWFTFALSIVLFGYVDWHALTTCTDEQTCQAYFSSYMHSSIFATSSSSSFGAWIWNGMLFTYVLIGLTYGALSTYLFVMVTLRDAWEAKHIFEHVLGISSRKLEGGAIDWNVHVVERFQQLQQSGEYRILIGTTTTTTTTTTTNNRAGTATAAGRQTTTTTPNYDDSNDEWHSNKYHPPSAAAAANMTLLPGGTTSVHSNINNNISIDALAVAQRIMRKDNFMIAFFNQRNLLNLTLPKALTSFLPMVDDTMVFYSKTLEWTIYFCILNYMFNHKYQIRPAFYLDPNSLKRRFVVCGMVHAIFLPFIVFFMTLHFGMQHVYDWKSTKQYMGPKEWSASAKWKIREFNELAHHMDLRLEPSYDATEQYLLLFTQPEWISTIGRLLAFVGGSFGAILLVLAAMNDAIVLHVKIGDWNLLWYVGIMAALYSAGKAMLPLTKQQGAARRNLFHDMDVALEEVAAHTHYFPDHWIGRGWDKTTYQEVSNMYMAKAKIFVLEIVSVIVAPIILCFSLPQSAEGLCEFVMAIKSEVPGSGDICGYSTFDFDSFGDAKWEGRRRRCDNDEGMSDGNGPATHRNLSQSLSASVQQLHNVEAAIQQHETPRAADGKMEKSFFSFQASHPTWKISTRSGQDLAGRVEHYKAEEEASMSRERQHHLEAVARQLETLAEMEEQRRLGGSTTVSGSAGIGLGTPRFDEQYLLRRRTEGQVRTGAPYSEHEVEQAGLAAVDDRGADSGGGVAMSPQLEPTPFASPPPMGYPDTSTQASPVTTRRIAPLHESTLSPPFSLTPLDRVTREMTPPPFATNPPPTPPQESAVDDSLTAASSLATTATTTLQAVSSSAGLRAAGTSTNTLRSTNSASVLHYADTALSTELRRMLNRSTLADTGDMLQSASGTGGVGGGSSTLMGGGALAVGARSRNQHGLMSLFEDRPLSDDASAGLASGQPQDASMVVQDHYLWLERYRRASQGRRNNNLGRSTTSMDGNGVVQRRTTSQSMSGPRAAAHYQPPASQSARSHGAADQNVDFVSQSATCKPAI